MRATVCILNAAVAAAATAAPAPVLTWLSEPTLPGETLLVHGAGFTLNCSLIVTPSPAAPGWNSPAVLPAIAGQSTEGSLKFALPASLPPGALSVAVSCGDGAPSAPWLLNAAVPWWAQGDVGAAATPGGWLRVMGPVLALAPAPEATLLAAIRAARDALTAPGTAADAAWADESPLAATAARLLAARAELADVRARGGGARPVTARLTPRGGGAALYLPAARDTASLHSAAFALPHSLPVGEYDVAVANGCGADTDAGAPAGAGTFVALDFFESMARPHVTGIAVIAPRAWPPGVFLVDTPSDPCAPLPCPSSDAALARALDAARSAGGGTVLFPRGAYFLTQPIAVPPNTVLMGEGGAEAVAVWFAEWNVTSAPKAPLFALDDAAAAASSAPAAQGVGVAGSGLASWGLSSFTLFLTAFHNEVIVVSNHTDGCVRELRVCQRVWCASCGKLRLVHFLQHAAPQPPLCRFCASLPTSFSLTYHLRFVMDGMRVRDNPYVFTWGAGPTQGSRGRVANFSISEIGQMVDIHGVNNRIVSVDEQCAQSAPERCTHTYPPRPSPWQTNNDLWGAGHILNSFAPNGGAGNNWPSWRRGHAYSYIADNVLWNGQSSHFMQLWRQVIFERNVITGATTNAGGQSVGTGPMGGVAQHIYHADNVIRFTWGGDREVMTYDDAGGAYYGPLESVNGTTVTLARDAWPASDWEMGGWGGGQIVVINGTGANQIARIVVPGVNVTPALSNRTWVVDSLFVAAPAVGEGGSWVQVLPFRGRNIFHRDSNIEVCVCARTRCALHVRAPAALSTLTFFSPTLRLLLNQTGPHQFYGHGVESLVTDVHFSSVRGLMAWGQWRGWVPPPPMNNSTWLLHDGDSPLSSRGAMGNGWQPNLHNVYRGVVFTERHHLTNYACGESGYEEQWSWKPIVTYPVSVLNVNITNTPHPVNIGLVYRGTQAPGGFFIGNDTVDVVIEGSNISWSSGECIVRGDLEALVYAANNACAE